MRRVVLKVGSAVLSEQGRVAKERMFELVKFIAELRSADFEIILVTSGAVAAGYGELKVDKKILANKQALASLGQPLLMESYNKKFSKFEIKISQLLLTADDFDSRKRTVNAKNAINILLKNKIVPIINENDVTATEELVFGDNDRLSAHVAYYFDAQMLIILTDIDSFYDKNPKEHSDAKPYKVVTQIEEEWLAQKHSPSFEFATGGIVTKIEAANFLLDRGLPMFLTSGFDLQYARSFLIDKNHTRGTLFKKE